jgi:hypothetical protein
MKMLHTLSLALGLSIVLFAGPTLADEPKVTVYKTPTCGCCKKWVTHLEKSGFEVETIDMRDLGMIKSMSGVEPKLASCHTAQVGGYVIEGHVPADDIKRLLSEHPAVKGLTVPGMPHGSPGMETGRKVPYQVLTFDAEGKTQVFAQH